MARKLFFLLIFIGLYSNLFSQPRQFRFGSVETNLIQDSKDEFSLYVSFRIPFTELIFSKEDSVYTSGAEFFCEVYDGDKLVERKSVTESVKVSTYEESLNESSNIQTLMVFKLYKSKFSVKPSLLRNNTNFTFPLKEIELDLVNNGRKIRPIVIETSKYTDGYLLVNKENVIPYDDKSYSLLVPVYDSLANAGIQILQNNISLLDTAISSLPKNTCKIIKSGGSIYADIHPNAGSISSYIKISLPGTIDEGDLQINVEQNKKKTIFNIPVVWLKKPFILNDLDLSIRLLNIITDGKSAEMILKQPSGQQYSLLKKEWNKISNSKSAGLNMLMNEFYSRADYAVLNFSYNGQRNGTETDRGKVYLRFGKPTSIERDYNNKNEIIEIWYYENLKKEFVFEDTTGKGNYSLRK